MPTNFVAPRDWLAGELVTATIMDEHIRNQFNALFPYLAAGDLAYYQGSGILGVLPIGNANQALIVNATEDGIEWGAALPPGGSNGDVLITAGGVSVWRRHYLALVSHSANQSLSNNNEVTLAWDTDIFDVDEMHGSPNSRLVAPVDGIYRVALNGSIHAKVSPTVTAHRQVAIYAVLSGGTKEVAVSDQYGDTLNNAEFSLSGLVELHESEYVYATAIQNTGTTINFDQDGACKPNFSLEFLRDL